MSENSEWEQAYARFETPRQEVAKFRRRLRALGVDTWDREAGVLELFCGRGNGLVAWRELGFRNVVGLDLSPTLLSRSLDQAALCIGDARVLPILAGSRAIVCIQGGLHHLGSLQDLRLVLDEAWRVLIPGGRVIIVEPWLTPFLRAVHLLVKQRPIRVASVKADALATMIDVEGATYESWLNAPGAVRAEIERVFELHEIHVRRGKLAMVGIRRERARERGAMSER